MNFGKRATIPSYTSALIISCCFRLGSPTGGHRLVLSMPTRTTGRPAVVLRRRHHPDRWWSAGPSRWDSRWDIVPKWKNKYRIWCYFWVKCVWKSYTYRHCCLFDIKNKIRSLALDAAPLYSVWGRMVMGGRVWGRVGRCDGIIISLSLRHKSSRSNQGADRHGNVTGINVMFLAFFY